MVDGDSEGKFYVNVCGELGKCGSGNSACVEKQGLLEPIAAYKTQEIIINGTLDLCVYIYITADEGVLPIVNGVVHVSCTQVTGWRYA